VSAFYNAEFDAGKGSLETEEKNTYPGFNGECVSGNEHLDTWETTVREEWAPPERK